MNAAPSRFLAACRDSATGAPASPALEAIARALQGAPRVAVTAHINPDGDALGSTAALVLALRGLGKEAHGYFDTAAPSKLLPLVPGDAVTFLSDGAAIESLPSPDVWAVLDTNEPQRTGRLQGRIFAPGQRRLVLDHHLIHSPPPFDLTCIVPEAPSTSTLVLALAGLLDVPLSPAMAQLLWMGLATDTGWFSFDNTGDWALADAATLAATGIPVPRLHEQLYEEAPIGRVRFLGRVLARLESHFDGAVIVAATSLAEAAADGLAIADLDGVIDQVKAVQGTKIAVLIVETEARRFKVSLRARDGHEVESIARKLGGGGHAKAAGCKFTGTYEALWSVLGAEIGAQLARR